MKRGPKSHQEWLEELDAESAPGSSHCSSDESVVYGLVVAPSQADVWQIACDAMADKQRLFKEYGWDINHKINEGDVKCVLRAIMATAMDRINSGR